MRKASMASVMNGNPITNHNASTSWRCNIGLGMASSYYSLMDTCRMRSSSWNICGSIFVCSGPLASSLASPPRCLDVASGTAEVGEKYSRTPSLGSVGGFDHYTWRWAGHRLGYGAAESEPLRATLCPPGYLARRKKNAWLAATPADGWHDT